MTTTILVDAAHDDVNEGIAAITLNPPRRLNALLPGRRGQDAELLLRADADSAVRAQGSFSRSAQCAVRAALGQQAAVRERHAHEAALAA